MANGNIAKTEDCLHDFDDVSTEVSSQLGKEKVVAYM